MTLLTCLTFLLIALTVTLTILLFFGFISSDTSICSTKAFPPSWNSDHFVVPVSIDFPPNSKQDTLFHYIDYNYSCADWEGICDQLRNVPLEDVFKLGASANANVFFEWAQAGTDVHIPHSQYQLKPHLSSWISAVCAAAIVDRNYQQNKSSKSVYEAHNEPWSIEGFCSWLYYNSSSKELWPWTFICNISSISLWSGSCFPDCWKALLVVPVFKNVGERSAKNYHPFSILSVVRKVFEKPVGLFIT